ncbi:hypothetical protein [Pseudomonas leptonychotis]|uniref:hypothetical protein n=1 Tax=Pseudomonas leptonychotis TaxID=2448482 RepID=UPI00386DC594
MEWLVPLFVFLMAFVFWRLSWWTDDQVVAWCRFYIAVVLAVIGIAVSIGLVLS